VSAKEPISKTTISRLSSRSPVTILTELSRFLKYQYNFLCLSRQQVLFFATSYVIPLALICGLYLCMLLRLWRGVAPGGHVSAESRRGKKRVTRMVVVVVAIFAICWFPIQVQYLHVYYHCVVSFISYYVPHNKQCTFYRVPDYDSCMGQEAWTRQDDRELRNSSMIQGDFDCKGRMDCKFPADAGFISDTAAVTTAVLKNTIKLTPCICHCF
jgi:hypothetical protein